MRTSQGHAIHAHIIEVCKIRHVLVRCFLDAFRATARLAGRRCRSDKQASTGVIRAIESLAHQHLQARFGVEDFQRFRLGAGAAPVPGSRRNINGLQCWSTDAAVHVDSLGLRYSQQRSQRTCRRSLRIPGNGACAV